MLRSAPAIAIRVGPVAAALLLAACGRFGPQPVDLGRFDGHTYTQESLGLRIVIPQDWTIVAAAESGELKQTGRRILSSGDPEGRAYASAGEPTSRTLFTVLRHPRGTVRGVNPSLVGAIENVAARPQIRTAVDYLQMLQSFLARGGTPILFQPIVPETALGGRSFAVLAATIQSGEARIGQIYYCRRIGDEILTLVATFGTPEQWAEVEAVLQTTALEK